MSQVKKKKEEKQKNKIKMKKDNLLLKYRKKTSLQSTFPCLCIFLPLFFKE